MVDFIFIVFVLFISTQNTIYKNKVFQKVYISKHYFILLTLSDTLCSCYLRVINSYLTILFISTGDGVFTTQQFSKGDFLLVYHGDVLTDKEGVEKEARYPTFLYFFTYKSKKLW